MASTERSPTHLAPRLAARTSALISPDTMPELLSVTGRCPRCSQVLTVPAGQLQSVFRCARCQYRVPGAMLVEEARSSPPRAVPDLRPFDEDSDDQRTRIHVP